MVLHAPDEHNTHYRCIRIAAMAEEHEAMARVLSYFAKAPFGYDLCGLVDDKDMVEIIKDCEEILQEMYESAGSNRRYHVKSVPDWEGS